MDSLHRKPHVLKQHMIVRADQHPEAPAWERSQSLRQDGQAKDAAALLRKALIEAPDNYRLHFKLGLTLCELDRHEEAIGEFLSALRLRPDFSEACHRIGSAFAARGIFPLAADWFARAREMNPQDVSYFSTYGRTLLALRRNVEAQEVFAHWVASDPDNPLASHLANAALGDQSQSKAPSCYVKALFDGIAQGFDAHLEKLKYCGPDLVLDALSPITSASLSKWEMLDVGCGTGLVGVAVRPFARRLVGVDLSTRMLDAARRRNIYDELIESDIVQYMRGHERSFDIVTASDVLTYFGDCGEFFETCALALRPGGVVIVLVETNQEGDDYRLNMNGRFSHGRAYLRAVMEDAGLVVARLDNVVMRLEAKQPVATLLAIGMTAPPSSPS